jgi:hypothetical protein
VSCMRGNVFVLFPQNRVTKGDKKGSRGLQNKATFRHEFKTNTSAKLYFLSSQ